MNKRRQSQRRVIISGWATLHANLLTFSLQFNKIQDVASAFRVCKQWNSLPADNQNALYRNHYTCMYGLDSSEDATIAGEAGSDNWKLRLQRRYELDHIFCNGLLAVNKLSIGHIPFTGVNSTAIGNSSCFVIK